MRITKYQYYLLPEAERKGYEYHSNEIGCYFEKNEQSSNDQDTKNKVDDFERLTNKKKEG